MKPANYGFVGQPLEIKFHIILQSFALFEKYVVSKHRQTLQKSRRGLSKRGNRNIGGGLGDDKNFNKAGSSLKFFLIRKN